MILGITGTREGPTEEQQAVMAEYISDAEQVLHGDCVGVDETAHNMAKASGVPVKRYPPTNPRLRAYCDDAEETHRQLPYLERNKRIVAACDFLLVVPNTFEEQVRSGTWSTRRWADRTGTAYVIVYPDGKVETGEDRNDQDRN